MTYKKLRGAIKAEGLTLKEFSREVLGKTDYYINTRLNGKDFFTIEDVYKTMDFLKKPYCEFCIYFPKNREE